MIEPMYKETLYSLGDGITITERVHSEALEIHRFRVLVNQPMHSLEDLYQLSKSLLMFYKQLKEK